MVAPALLLPVLFSAANAFVTHGREACCFNIVHGEKLIGQIPDGQCRFHQEGLGPAEFCLDHRGLRDGRYVRGAAGKPGGEN
jgi:hypothetical protein